MKDMIEVYFEDLSRRVKNEIRGWKYVDDSIINNDVPIAVILPEDVSDYLDNSWEEYEKYDDEFSNYSEYDKDDFYDDEFDDEL